MKRTSDHIGIAFRFIVFVVRPVLAVFTRRSYLGHIPQTGPVILACNHISIADPPVVGAAVYENGRVPRFLGKASLFSVPFMGMVLRSAGQIPVERRSLNAAAALVPAKQVLDSNGCVVIYPEGGLTTNSDLWPDRGKTGAVRLALMTGAPLIPMAVWGTAAILPKNKKLPKFFPRSKVTVSFGEPVDLSQFANRADESDALRAGTVMLMAAITELVAHVRDERPAQSGGISA
jgi:1-acyl-sn-glycerol-3-phosphate acyltransferase